jgi:hypothetical protein
MLTGVALSMLAASAHAAPFDPASAAGGDVQAQPTGLYARIARPFGAALRESPSSQSELTASLLCGEAYPVLEMRDGWVKVRVTDGTGWVGGGRVTVGSPPPPADCDGARDMLAYSHVTTWVESGCLSLRTQPSRNAPITACVQNGYDYVLVDGPFDPGTGEDWFRVQGRGTGYGWVLAEHLFPY